MNKRVIAIAAAASVLLVGIWYVAIFSSQSKSLKNANNQVAAANADATTLRAQIGVLQQEKAHLSAATDKLTALKAALPDTPALDKLIDDINAAAIQSGVDWQTLTPAKPGTFTAAGGPVAGGFPGGMQSVTVALQANGSYKQVTDFITKLMGISRLMDVNSVNLSGIGGAAKSSAQITTQMFFVPVPPGSVPAATAKTAVP